MRIFIAVFLFFCCYSLSLYAKKAETSTAVKNSAKKSINFSKKQRNSLKTERFSDQADFLYHSTQNHSLVAVHFVKAIQGSSIHDVNINFDYILTPILFYNFIFPYLYPKHSFW